MSISESSPRNTASGTSPRWGMSQRASSGCIDDPRWQLALRIATSSSVGRSRLMGDFLLYVVDRQIHDRNDEITEQQIGVLVFGRSEGYDTNEDNIVRSYARNLRKRIEEYFESEGIQEKLLLEIPRGGYIPIFSQKPATDSTLPAVSSVEPNNHLQKVATSASEDPQPNEGVSNSRFQPEQGAWSKFLSNLPTTLKRRVQSNLRILIFCAGLLLGIISTLLIPRASFKRIVASPAETASNTLFSQLFNKRSNTYIVPSDDGLVIMQRLTERPVPLASYVDGSYRTKIVTAGNPTDAEIVKLGGRRYTSMVDLELASRLAQLSEAVPEHMFIRYARDLRMEDLRNGNAIFIGSIEANPWIELFQSQLPIGFSIHPGNDKASGILNKHPRPGEATIYGTPVQDHTYGFIAYAPSLNATGHVLIIAGLNTAGTEAAATFLLNPTLMAPTLEHARLGKGGFKPFVILIGAGNVASNAATPQVVLERIGPF